MRKIRLSLSLLLVLMPREAPGFAGNQQQALFGVQRTSSGRARRRRDHVALSMSGEGVAANYTWKEEAFEIDVTVQVPKGTRAKDIAFRATTTSIDLRLLLPPPPPPPGTDGKEAATTATELVLLDPGRKLRGRVNVDGTYWVISDSEDGDKGRREVTVTIEKLIRTPKDDFEVVDYDWKGVYSNDGDEVSYRRYDEPEVLNVREYAASLGVDIDNINMSMVDKTMFSSGMNLTKSSYDELAKAGYVKEVTRQADGSEYTINDDDKPQAFNALGESVSQDEIRAAMKNMAASSSSSPWKSAIPVEVDKETNKTYVRNFTRAAFAEEASAKNRAAEMEDKKRKVAAARRGVAGDPVDPIDTLTVARLKEILKSQGLKVSGTKKELQNRLRQQVNSMLQGSDRAPDPPPAPPKGK